MVTIRFRHRNKSRRIVTVLCRSYTLAHGYSQNLVKSTHDHSNQTVALNTTSASQNQVSPYCADACSKSTRMVLLLCDVKLRRPMFERNRVEHAHTDAQRMSMTRNGCSCSILADVAKLIIPQSSYHHNLITGLLHTGSNGSQRVQASTAAIFITL